MAIDSQFWAGRRVLLTGHTGFKGAWLSLWLQMLGARVTGLAAPGAPTEPSLYALARVGEGMEERAVDIRDAGAVQDAIGEARPEVVLHLAAQPLVRRSHREPVLTYEVNVMGTVNVLEAVRQVGEEVRAVVVVTSDKCYENPSSRPDGNHPGRSGANPLSRLGANPPGQPDANHPGRSDANHPDRPARRFVEGDPLGGADPYSSSKACAELVTAAYRSSFFSEDSAGSRADDAAGSLPDDAAGSLTNDTARPAERAGTGPAIATARAGNVIGGGDWGADRLIPDIVRAVETGASVRVRNPDAVRPWQHVLNPLCGYLTLAQALWRGHEAAAAWNFGPAPHDARTVGWIVRRLAERWGDALCWEADGDAAGQAGGDAAGPAEGDAAARAGVRAAADLNPPEAAHLALDSSRAERGLGWRSWWDLEQALDSVVQWHEAYRRGEDMRQTTVSQIGQFDQLAS